MPALPAFPTCSCPAPARLRPRPQELIVHPFWQVSLASLAMPAEPALDSFIKAYKLAPADANPRASMASQSAVRAPFCPCHGCVAVWLMLSWARAACVLLGG